MRLNPDCIRDVLLYLENNLDIDAAYFCPVSRVNILKNFIDKYNKKDLLYTIIQLSEYGYISTNFSHKKYSAEYTLSAVYYITPKGHEFISKIVDEESWKSKVMPVVSVLGSVSMSVLETLACGATEGALTVLQNRLIGTP